MLHVWEQKDEGESVINQEYLVLHNLLKSKFKVSNGFQALTHLLGHLLHDVVGDVSDWCVAQALEEVVVTLQLHSADASIISMRIQGANEYQETQQ